MNRYFYCLILTVCVCLCGTALGEGAQPVVRVGDISYDARQVQSALDELMALSEASGIALTDADCVEAAENTIENFVVRGLAENRIHELKLDELSKDVEYSIADQAQQAYERAWQQVRAQYSEDELTDEQITYLLEAADVSNEAYYREYALGYEMSLLLEHYGVSVELSDAELDEFYQENYVSPYEERYAENIPLYESEILFGDGDSLFIPQGYRRIRQILLPVPEQIQSELDALNARADELNETAQAAYADVAALAVEGKDVEAARETYAQAKAQLDQLEVEEGRLRAKILPALQETVDEIFARLRSGESFESIAALYGEAAEELPYHPQSEAWTDEYAQTLNTLNAPGDVSQPAVCADGVHIFCYAEDIPSGAVRLSGEQRAMVDSAARQSLSSRALIELVSAWRADYEIETDISQLNF